MMTTRRAGFHSFAVCLTSLVTLATCISSRSSASYYSFWDTVRMSNETKVLASSENLFLVAIQNNNNNSAESLVRLADVKVFLPFSINGQELRPGVAEDAFAALLAQNEWNEHLFQQQGEDQQDCNVRLTMEFVDTQLSPIIATKAFTDIQQRNSSVQQPAPTAIVGAFRSAVTAPLALLAGLSDIPQVSHASTSSDFDVKALFPTFGRTVTNSAGEATVALEYFSSIGSTHVAVLYVTDSFGSALQKTLSEASTEFGIEVAPFTFSPHVDAKEAASVMKQLQTSGFRHVYAIVYDQHLPVVLEAASESGLVSKDYLWFYPGLDLEALRHGNVSPDVARYLDGAAIISMQATVTSDTLYVGQVDSNQRWSYMDEHAEHASLRKLWQDKREDDDFNIFVKSKIPSSLAGIVSEEFSASLEPSSLRPFLYDAIISLATSMCRAGNATHLFSGSEVFDQFRVLNRTGTSGYLGVDPETGSRDYRTVKFVLWNSRMTQDPSRVLALVPTSQYTERSWKPIDGNRFMYHNGSTKHPPALPPLKENLNVISRFTRSIGLALAALTAASCIVCLLWILFNWKKQVVLSANRGFLLIILTGTLVMALTVIPLSQDENTIRDFRNLDLTCQLSPWIYVGGVSLVVGGLLAKILSIRQACLDPFIETVELSSKRLFTTTFGLLLVNGVILIVWTLVDPLEWTRTDKSHSDQYSRLTESYASCESDHDGFFIAALCAVNLMAVIVANVILLRSSSIELEYHESRYLGFCVLAFFQAWCMGAPLVSVVHDNPEGRFLVQMGIVFVTSQVVVSLIFIPRILASLRQATMEQKS